MVKCLLGTLWIAGCGTDGYGVIEDTRDGTIYEWVEVGDQKWFRTNLAYLPKVNWVSEQSDTIPMYYVYGNESQVVQDAINFQLEIMERDTLIRPYEEYGVLYNHAAILTSPGVCPEGWRVPSDGEWKNLEIALGMEIKAAEYLGDRHEGMLGHLMKDRSGWDNEGNGVDSFGLAIKPAGSCFSGSSYHSQAIEAVFWTRTIDQFGDAMVRKFSCCSSGITREWADRRDGYSVRCVQ